MAIPFDKAKARTYLQRWQELKSFTNTTWHKPDPYMLTISLAQYVSHLSLEDDPIWTFLLGRSSSGKSSIAARALSFLPDVYDLGTLTTRSFLSGFGKDQGLLQRLTVRDGVSNGVLVFSDFSTFLDLRQEVRSEISSQLRRIFDGQLTHNPGSGGKTLTWTGKVTIVAYCTPSLENYWGVNADLGERFIYYKSKGSNVIDDTDNNLLKVAMGQLGKEGDIYNRFQYLVLNYVDLDDIELGKLSTDEIIYLGQSKGIFNLVKLIGILRTSVKRDSSLRDIVYIAEPESSPRLGKSLIQVGVGNATLQRRRDFLVQDVRLINYMGESTIPTYRWRIVNHLYHNCDKHQDSEVNILKVTDIPKTSLFRTLEDLEAIKVITRPTFTLSGRSAKLTSHIVDLLDSSSINWLRQHDKNKANNVLTMPATESE